MTNSKPKRHPTSLSQELAQLDAVAGRAWERVKATRDARRNREALRLSVEAIEPLWGYCEDVAHRKRTPDPELHRRLTLDLLESVHAHGYVLNVPGRGLLQVVDPALDDELPRAEAAHREAVRLRDSFAMDHADQLADERRAAEMERVREALAGSDPDALREALAATG